MSSKGSGISLGFYSTCTCSYTFNVKKSTGIIIIADVGVYILCIMYNVHMYVHVHASLLSI